MCPMPRLVANWKQCHRWYSVRAQALSVAVFATWQLVPEDLRAVAPHWLQVTVLVLMLLAGLASRLVEQPNVPSGPDTGRIPG